jgi:hypothetical protein
VTSICSAVWRIPGAIQQLLLFQLVAFVFGKDRFLAEIAAQIKRYAEGYDILEKEETQITHVPHPVNPRYGNNRAGGSYDHSAGCKEHDRRDERSYDAGIGAKIARDNQDGGKAHGNADKV